MVLQDLEVLVRGGQFTLGPELDHLERRLHQTTWEALEAGTVLAVTGQDPSLPTDPASGE